MSTYGVSDDKLKAIADAIRLKTDNPAGMTVDDMPLQIALISGGAKHEEFVVPSACGTGEAFVKALKNAGIDGTIVIAVIKAFASSPVTYQAVSYFKMPNAVLEMFGVAERYVQLMTRFASNGTSFDAINYLGYAFACSAGDVFDVYTID